MEDEQEEAEQYLRHRSHSDSDIDRWNFNKLDKLDMAETGPLTLGIKNITAMRMLAWYLFRMSYPWDQECQRG